MLARFIADIIFSVVVLSNMLYESSFIAMEVDQTLLNSGVIDHTGVTTVVAVTVAW